MTKTDIEKRLESAISKNVAWEDFVLLRDASDEITRLRKRIAELEYRERSRECVKPQQRTNLSDALQDAVIYGTGRYLLRDDDVDGLNAHCREAMAKVRDEPSDRPDAVKILRDAAGRQTDARDERRRLSDHHGETLHYAVWGALTIVADALEQERKG